MIEALFWTTFFYWLIAAVIFVTATLKTSRYTGGYRYNARSQSAIRRNARIARRAWIWPWLIVLGLLAAMRWFAGLLAELKEKASE